MNVSMLIKPMQDWKTLVVIVVDYKEIEVVTDGFQQIVGD